MLQVVTIEQVSDSPLISPGASLARSSLIRLRVHEGFDFSLAHKRTCREFTPPTQGEGHARVKVAQVWSDAREPSEDSAVSGDHRRHRLFSQCDRLGIIFFVSQTREGSSSAGIDFSFAET